MKQQLITTPKARILVIDLPEGVKTSLVTTTNINYPDIDLVELGYNIKYLCTIPPGDWQLLGKLDEVKEGDAEGLGLYKSVYGYHNYLIGQYPFLTAKASLRSLIESEVQLSNPFGEKPDRAQYTLSGKNSQEIRMIEEDRQGQKPSWKTVFERNYQEKLSNWQAAESKVFKNPYLIVEFKK